MAALPKRLSGEGFDEPGMKMGPLVQWNDERGFGFITPSEGGNQMFHHISAIPKTSRRPRVGDTILYRLVTEADGRTRASGASIQGVVPLASPAVV